MSCGKPHETDCSEVLAEVWLFLDGECCGERREVLARHLEECDPCLAEYGIDEQLKALLARKCGGEQAPDRLKERLRQKIRNAVLEQTIERAEVREVTVETGPGGTTVEVRTTRIESRG